MKAPRAIAHPLSITALIALVLNDHVFKTRVDALPRWLTGKLSDVAFCALAPVVALSLYEALSRDERRRSSVTALSTIVIGAAFSLAKCTHEGALVAGWTLGALQAPLRGALVRAPIVVDPTDLVALPALALALWVERRTRLPPPADQ